MSLVPYIAFFRVGLRMLLQIIFECLAHQSFHIFTSSHQGCWQFLRLASTLKVSFLQVGVHAQWAKAFSVEAKLSPFYFTKYIKLTNIVVVQFNSLMGQLANSSPCICGYIYLSWSLSKGVWSCPIKLAGWRQSNFILNCTHAFDFVFMVSFLFDFHFHDLSSFGSSRLNFTE
jgi:hypothetical protein